MPHHIDHIHKVTHPLPSYNPLRKEHTSVAHKLFNAYNKRANDSNGTLGCEKVSIMDIVPFPI